MRESRRKRLTRSSTNRVIGGVFGGLGKYLNCPPNLLRVIYAILTFFTAVVPGVIVYFILMIIIPPDPKNPGILGIFQSLNDLNRQYHPRQRPRSRRQLHDVEEKDIKRNGRS